MIKCSYPSITDLEKEYINDCLSKGDIGVGEYIGKFEDYWARWNRMDYGVACNSGTNALFLALKALGIGPGDEVIVPEFTMVATAWAVSYTGATPVFVDCANDLNIDRAKIDDVITNKTKAIILVPIYGREISIETYFTARKNGLYIIEDMAEAHGLTPRGDIACYSFYGNKILTTGEGGMCLTNNQEWADEMRLLANMYFDKERKMIHPKMGYNFRMTNLQAAIGFAQARRIKEILAKRQKIQEWYDLYLPEHLKMPRRDVVWMYDIRTDHQEELKQKLADLGIESRYGFKPMSMQPDFLNENYQDLNAYHWSKRILYLPTFTDMTEGQVKEICQVLKS
jgi:perosamine synthetase